MLDALSALVLAVVNVMMLAAFPSMARCPEGWALGEGVRRQGDRIGEFACHSPLPKTCGEPGGIYERPCPPGKRLVSRIYCTSGALPIIVDARTVGCQR